MAIRAILHVGHPVLRRQLEPVPQNQITSPEIQALIDDLIDTMRHANGAGIAANQIGAEVQIATIEVTQNPRYPYKPPIDLTVIINPTFRPLDGETVTINEGCLSVPGLRGDLQRHVSIEVSYLDRHGEQHTEVRRGLTAGTFQHEIDHLNGRMILDHIDPATYTTWEMFDRYHRDAFVTRIESFVARIGS
jgi:peptide deformylase